MAFVDSWSFNSSHLDNWFHRRCSHNRRRHRTSKRSARICRWRRTDAPSCRTWRCRCRRRATRQSRPCSRGYRRREIWVECKLNRDIWIHRHDKMSLEFLLWRLLPRCHSDARLNRHCNPDFRHTVLLELDICHRFHLRCHHRNGDLEKRCH